jgi:hypothetical protein
LVSEAVSEAREHVDEWSAAGLMLARGAVVEQELIDHARQWIDAVLDVLPLLPPLGVILDLGRLLARAPFDIAKSEHVGDPELRAGVDAYEEHVLGRLSADIRLESARDALLRLEPRLRAAATAVFIEQVLARIREVRLTDEFDAPGPAAVRRVMHQHSIELVERGRETLEQSEHAELRAELAASYANLARSARSLGALIGDVELYTLENLEALHTPSLRLAMAQIAEAAQAIERTLPVRVRRSDASRGRTPTKVEDESAYPIGGYASISTSGGIESLVSSELIYMATPAERAAGGVDLFDVRWAANELLKYTRDESVHTRERRTINFVLMPALDAARVKDSGVPFQRLVVALGGLVAGVRKLCAWLDEAELALEFLFVSAGAKHQPLQAEAALLELILREHIEAKIVRVLEVRDADAARAHAQTAAESGGSDIVWLLAEGWQPSEPNTPAAAPGLRRGPSYREHALSVERATPRVWVDSGRGTEERALRAEGWDGWLRAFAELAAALV